MAIQKGDYVEVVKTREDPKEVLSVLSRFVFWLRLWRYKLMHDLQYKSKTLFEGMLATGKVSVGSSGQVVDTKNDLQGHCNHQVRFIRHDLRDGSTVDFWFPSEMLAQIVNR